MTEQANTNEETGLEAEALSVYHQVELHAEDLDEYTELGLPSAHPHLFAKSLLAQLARLPLMELDREREVYSEHTVALSA